MKHIQTTRDFSPLTKFALVGIVAVSILFGYFAINALGDTTINLTLNTNPTLEDGLVAHWTFDGKDMDWVTSTTTEAQDISGNGYHADVQPDFASSTPATGDAATYVSSGGGTGTSFSYDIGTANNRLVVVMPADENTGTNLTGVTVDGKSCNSVQQTTNSFSEGSHTELWYCDEDDLGASSGSVTVALTGADTGWATHVHLFNNVAQTGPGDSGVENAGTNTDTISIESIDTYQDGVLVMSAGASTQSINFTAWTSPLVERLETPDPSAHTFGSASGIPTSDASAGTFTATLNQTSGTISGVIGSWDNEPSVAGETEYISTTTMVTAGNLGQALAFNGVDEYVDVGNVTSGIKSIAFWVRVATTTANAKMIDIDGTDQIETDGSSAITATSFPGTTIIYQDGVAGNTTLTSDWHHIVVTDTTGVNASDFDIGRIETEGYFGGDIDDVRLYNRVLSKDEVKRLHGLGATTKIALDIKTNPTLLDGLIGHWTFDGNDIDLSAASAEILDTSGQGNTGNAVGGGGAEPDVEPTSGRLGQALSFDGLDDYVDLGNVGSGIKTVSFWVKGATSTTANLKIIDIDGIDQIETDGSSAITATSFPGTTIIYQDGVAGDTTLNPGWRHIVITDTTGVSGTDFDIARIEGEGYFPGDIDDVRIYNRVLSKTEVIRLYELGATAKISAALYTNPDLEKGLVGHWTFDGKDLWTYATDKSTSQNHGKLRNYTSTTTKAGKIGQALLFDGSNDFVDIGNAGSGIQTIAFWMKAEAAPVSMKIIDIDGTDQIELNGSGAVTATSFPASTVYVDGSSASAVISDKNWHHVIITDTTGVNATDFDIGRVEGVGNYNGRIDDVRLYDRVLSKDEINRLYEVGN